MRGRAILFPLLLLAEFVHLRHISTQFPVRVLHATNAHWGENNTKSFIRRIGQIPLVLNPDAAVAERADEVILPGEKSNASSAIGCS